MHHVRRFLRYKDNEGVWSMQLFGIRTPLIKPGDNIVDILIYAISSSNIKPQNNDIIVLAESAVATAEGRIVNLKTVKPSEKAVKLSKLYDTDPGKMELIIRESDEIVGGIPGVVVTITKGVLSPSAGIDNSNAPEGHVVLLPENPQKSAAKIRKKLMAEYGCNIAVIIGDSRTQPLRLGCVGIALGCAGIEPVEDVRGKTDLFGKPLLITRRATADNLVSAAEIIMGEADEGIPAVLIRDAPAIFIDRSVDIPTISRDECLYFGCFRKL
ncbi:MAG: coenzyme F420-0:L-glutamate ligase [Candidatus Methanoperedens sp.]|nr:coenzyme F420-0:L-glutamate ligase [Candidatus Methanoperedens sp.]